MAKKLRTIVWQNKKGSNPEISVKITNLGKNVTERTIHRTSDEEEADRVWRAACRKFAKG